MLLTNTPLLKPVQLLTSMLLHLSRKRILLVRHFPIRVAPHF